MNSLRKFLLLLVYFTFGFQNMLLIGGQSINVYLLVILFLLTFFRFFRSHELNSIPRNIIMAFLFMVIISLIYFLITLIEKHELQYSFVALFRLFEIILILILTFNISTDDKYINKLVQVFILGYYVLLIGVFYNYFTGNFTIYRVSAQHFNQNYMSMGLVSAIPFTFYLAFIKKYNRILNILYIILTFFAVILAASRGGMINYLFTVSFSGLIFFKNLFSKKNFLFFIFIGLLFVYLNSKVTTLNFSNLNRNINRLMSAQSEIGQGNLNYRTVLWKDALTVFMNNPMGIGAGQFNNYNPLSLGTQNGFLEILVSFGLVGLFFYVYLISTFFKFLLSSSVNIKLKLLFSISFTSLIIGNLVSDFTFNEIFWVPFILAITIIYFIQKKQKKVNINEISIN